MILLPTTFPKPTSFVPSIAEKTLTINSGVEVPNATMVKPITICEIFSFEASDEEPPTRASAPFINKKKQTINKMIEKNIIINF